MRGRGNVVGIATRYGLDGPGIESRWRAKFSAPVQTFYTFGTESFPGGKGGRWVALTTHLHLAPKLNKE